MHRLTGRPVYLDRIERGIRRYYEKAGTGFYPIASNFAECLAALRADGRDTGEVERLLRAHVDAILARGNGYPSRHPRRLAVDAGDRPVLVVRRPHRV